MKILGFSIVGLVIMAVLFMTGLLNSSPIPLLAGFCGWTPATFVLGWAVRGLLIGRKIVLVRTEETREAPVNNRQSERIPTKARNM